MTNKAEKPRKASPINGQPLPRGKQFTSETAREARQKRAEKERREKSITKAFLALMDKDFENERGEKVTGAELMAEAILMGAAKNNAKMVELALAMTGETPNKSPQTDMTLFVAALSGAPKIGGEDE